MTQLPLSANPHRETVRVEGVYRAAPRRSARSSYGQRTLMEDTTTRAQRAREIERQRCPVCERMVPVRKDGEIKSHQSTRGIQCAGSVPVISSSSPPAMCEAHGEYRETWNTFACGCPAPRQRR